MSDLLHTVNEKEGVRGYLSICELRSVLLGETGKRQLTCAGGLLHFLGFTCERDEQKCKCTWMYDVAIRDSEDRERVMWRRKEAKGPQQ